MGDERRVAMVRLERPEEVYDVEEVLGRDVRSVFPKRATKQDTEQQQQGQMDADAIKEMLGARKFVTESELEVIKAQRGGGSVDDGTMAPLKPLAEVLREAKEKKEQDFADKWKMMKTGKNRPLDAEELEFLDQVADQEALRVKEQMAEERRELEEFRRATAEAAERAAAAAAAESAAGGAPAVLGPAAPAPAPSKPELKRPPPVKALVRAVIKPKGAPAAAPTAAATAAEGQQQDGGSSQPSAQVPGGSGGKEGDGAERDAKRPRTAAEEEDDQQPKLASLLGGYGSDDDED